MSKKILNGDLEVTSKLITPTISDGTNDFSTSDLVDVATETYVDTAISEAQLGGTASFDEVPTEDSNNAVRSGGIYDALEAKENVANRVNTISSASDNNHYPTAKAVYDVTTPTFEVSDSDNVLTFITDYNVNNRPIYIKHSTVTYLGVFRQNDGTNYAFEFESLYSATRVSSAVASGGAVDLQNVTFQGLFGSAYQLAYQTVKNKVNSLSSGSTNTQYPSAECVYNALATKEDVSNKVNSTTGISASSTDTQYPSAKAVYEGLQNVAAVAKGLTKTFVISCDDATEPTTDSDLEYLTKADGTPFTNISDFYNYIRETQSSSPRTLINGEFYSDDNYLEFDAGGSYFITYEGIRINDKQVGRVILPNVDLEIGDALCFIEVDAPDRWVIPASTEGYFSLAILETKLTNYYNKSEINKKVERTAKTWFLDPETTISALKLTENVQLMVLGSGGGFIDGTSALLNGSYDNYNICNELFDYYYPDRDIQYQNSSNIDNYLIFYSQENLGVTLRFYLIPVKYFYLVGGNPGSIIRLLDHKNPDRWFGYSNDRLYTHAIYAKSVPDISTHYINTQGATTGQVLTIDGSGSADWADLPSPETPTVSGTKLYRHSFTISGRTGTNITDPETTWNVVLISPRSTAYTRIPLLGTLGNNDDSVIAMSVDGKRLIATGEETDTISVSGLMHTGYFATFIYVDGTTITKFRMQNDNVLESGERPRAFYSTDPVLI